MNFLTKILKLAFVTFCLISTSFADVSIVNSPVLTYSPTLAGGGTMTISAQTLNYAYYTIRGKVIELNISYDTVTTATAGNASFVVPLPAGITLATTNGEIEGAGAGGGCFDGTTLWACAVRANDTTSIEVRKSDGSSWGTGASRSFKIFFQGRIL